MLKSDFIWVNTFTPYHRHQDDGFPDLDYWQFCSEAADSELETSSRLLRDELRGKPPSRCARNFWQVCESSSQNKYVVSHRGLCSHPQVLSSSDQKFHFLLRFWSELTNHVCLPNWLTTHEIFLTSSEQILSILLRTVQFGQKFPEQILTISEQVTAVTLHNVKMLHCRRIEHATSRAQPQNTCMKHWTVTPRRLCIT